MNSLLRLSSRCCRRNNHVTSKTSLQTQNSTRIVGGRLLSEDKISQHGALFSTRLGLGTMWRYMIMYVEIVDINTSTSQFAPRPCLLVRALSPCFAIPLHLHLAKCFPFYAPSFSCYVRNQERALSKREMIRQLRDEIRLESESQVRQRKYWPMRSYHL